MNDQLRNILTNKSDGYLTIEEVDLPYFSLINIEASEYRFGYCERGWLFFDQEHTSLIHWEDGNYISMVKILQIGPEKLVDQLQKNIKAFSGKTDDIHLFFPIKNLTELSFQMGGSGYWIKLCLDFLTHIEFYNFDTTFMEEYVAKYKLLKHKIQKFVARSKWEER